MRGTIARQWHGHLDQIIAVVVVTVLAMVTTASFAFGVGDESDSPLMRMGNDCLWAGETLDLDDVTIDNDLLAAGRTLNIEDCHLGGSIRAAGQTVSVSDTVADQSITIAGEVASVAGTKATAVAMAGWSASFDGTCSGLSMYASEVTIAGTVDGDAHVAADHIVVGKDAIITGTLHVNSPKEPVIEEGADVASVDYTKTEEETVADQVGAISSGLAGLSLAGSVVGVLGTLVVSLLAEWLFWRHTAAAAEMVRSRTVAHIASGIIGSLSAPLALIALCIMVITLPIAGCALLTLIAIALASGGFLGASLARLAFPRLGRYRGALAGGAIVGVVKIVPVLGALVRIAAFAYLFGYVLQTIYLDLRDQPKRDVDTRADDAGLPSPPMMK